MLIRKKIVSLVMSAVAVFSGVCGSFNVICSYADELPADEVVKQNDVEIDEGLSEIREDPVVVSDLDNDEVMASMLLTDMQHSLALLGIAEKLSAHYGMNSTTINSISSSAKSLGNIFYSYSDKDAERHFKWNFNCVKDGISDNDMRKFTANYEWADYISSITSGSTTEKTKKLNNMSETEIVRLKEE